MEFTTTKCGINVFAYWFLACHGLLIEYVHYFHTFVTIDTLFLFCTILCYPQILLTETHMHFYDDRQPLLLDVSITWYNRTCHMHVFCISPVHQPVYQGSELWKPVQVFAPGLYWVIAHILCVWTHPPTLAGMTRLAFSMTTTLLLNIVSWHYSSSPDLLVKVLWKETHWYR